MAFILLTCGKVQITARRRLTWVEIPIAPSKGILIGAHHDTSVYHRAPKGRDAASEKPTKPLRLIYFGCHGERAISCETGLNLHLALDCVERVATYPNTNVINTKLIERRGEER